MGSLSFDSLTLLFPDRQKGRGGGLSDFFGDIFSRSSYSIRLPGENVSQENIISINYPDIWGLYRRKKITPYRKAFIYSQKLAIVASKIRANVKLDSKYSNKSLC
jgi:hypothetical protein